MLGDELILEMKKRGFKLTPQRLAIIRVLQKLGDKHPPIIDIFKEVKRSIPTISFSTTYNTLVILQRVGLVRLFNVAGKIRVEVNTKPHINIIDMSTEKIVEFRDEDLINELLDRIGIKTKNVLINIYVFSKLKKTT